MPPAPTPRVRSEAPFSIPPDQADTIIRVCGHPRKDFERAVISFTPQPHDDSVQSSLIASPEPTKALGELDKLRLELLHQVCLYLDVESVLSLRQTNARAQQVVHAIHEYRVVTAYALDALRALLQTDTASRVTLRDFYRLLRTQACSFCTKRFGNLVYLPTWQRCCSRCTDFDPCLRPCTLASVKRIFNLSRTSLKDLPSLKVLPGTYDSYDKPYSRRVMVVPQQFAVSAYMKENGGAQPLRQDVNELNQFRHFALMACCTIPSYNLQTNTSQTGISCAGCRLFSEVLDQNDVGLMPQLMAYRARDAMYSRAVCCFSEALQIVRTCATVMEGKQGRNG